MAGAIGWTARDLAEASLWQVIAAHEGWKRANGADDGEGLTDSEFEELGAMLPTVH